MPRPYRKRGTKGKRDSRGWLDTRRNHRGAEYTPCNCGAYQSKDRAGRNRGPRPHQMFVGRCRPQKWVDRFYDPSRRDCIDCSNRDGIECQVVTQIEVAFQCPALREFIQYESIKLYGRAREAWERVTGNGLRRHQSRG